MMTEEQKKALINNLKIWISIPQPGHSNDIRDAFKLALAALTQPASPALKLPETISVRTAIAALDNASAVTTIAQSYKMAWNSCIAETERLNAPRTAPIEPICATGGAEWVKVPREPTQKMIDAHMEGMATGGAMKAYRQMLAAAPEEK